MSKHTLIIRLSSLLILLLVILGVLAASMGDYKSAGGLFGYAALISLIRGLASPTN